MWNRPALLTIYAITLLSAACAAPSPTTNQATNQEMLKLLLPSSVEIVQPFTRVGDLDENGRPNQIELWLRANNALDSPGLMIAGRLRVELFEHQPASGYAKGKRLESWNIELATEQDQRKYWNAVTQMYEFRLGLDPERIPPADQYVLTVTYQPPIGARISNEVVIEYGARPSRRPPPGR